MFSYTKDGGWEIIKSKYLVMSVIEIVCVCMCVCKISVKMLSTYCALSSMPNAGHTVLRRTLVPALSEPVV